MADFLIFVSGDIKIKGGGLNVVGWMYILTLIFMLYGCKDCRRCVSSVEMNSRLI